MRATGSSAGFYFFSILFLNICIGSLQATTAAEVGIREEIPDKYRSRFERWKGELNSTEYGRASWQRFADNKEFLLTIKIGRKDGGAGTDRFVWDEVGHLVGATITLGSELESGFPSGVYYPVLNALSPDQAWPAADGRILAAAKLSHELGHVRQSLSFTKAKLEQEQKLIPEYVSIFLKNGLNPRDGRLTDLADRLGGTPMALWEAREYQSEVEAALFLRERLRSEPSFCHVLTRVRRNLEEFAGDYRKLFSDIKEIGAPYCSN